MTTMTKEQAQARLEELNRQVAEIAKICPEAVDVRGTHTRIIKENSKGGLYIKDPSFKAWSEKNSKVYIAGINMPMGVAKALFGNEELLEQVKQFVQSQADDARLDGNS